MTVASILRYLTQQLQSLYAEQEAKAIARSLVQHYGNVSSVQLYTYPDMMLEARCEAQLMNALPELLSGRPLHYVLGETEFFGLKFHVNENVLIPRSETEELVRWAIAELKTLQSSSLQLLDMCTGSGCIAVSLASQFPEAKVSACDISEGALTVARENARRNNVEIDFFNGDILEDRDIFHSLSSYTMLISNPPYVRESEKCLMHKNVLDYEPAHALFVPDDDPLIFYRAIAQKANYLLASKGFLMVEINEAMGNEMKEFFRNTGFSEIEIRRDLSGKDRMLKANYT
jgi:release factor glutamine methyltransferase